LSPLDPFLQTNLAVVLGDSGRLTESIERLEEALKLHPGAMTARSNLLLTLHYDSSGTPERLKEEHRRWAERHAPAVPPMSPVRPLPPSGPPIFLKVAPDLEPADIDAIARLSVGQVDALIISNTTISRPPLQSPHAGETGGLSGAPLKALAQQRMADFARATGGGLPLIGVGGIGSAEDAYARIRAGASLIQLYSALVYEGPGLARRMNRGLAALLRRDGFTSIVDVVGVDIH
jgi:dihydroorotate dehydrogenase